MHGGKRFEKVNENVKNFLIKLIEENPLYTLNQMKIALQSSMNISLSIQTINRHLDGLSYSIKKYRMEPSTANNPQNKVARKEFVQKILAINSLICQ